MNPSITDYLPNKAPTVYVNIRDGSKVDVIGRSTGGLRRGGPELIIFRDQQTGCLHHVTAEVFFSRMRKYTCGEVVK